MLPAGYQHSGGEIVQWDTPIPPPEADELLAKMSTFKEATVYKVGHSYLGKDIWAMDLMPPIEASHWSHAKLTTIKPTIVYSARQHANEVSSTSHVLKLAELLLTDPEFQAKLNKVNVVIHPITNPDGAQLAYDLYTDHARLHAARRLSRLAWRRHDLCAVGHRSDLSGSRIRPEIWRTWLPDIFLNPHGYPSHEWVQLFSEYAGWVRNRVTEARDWWPMRGWFMPGFAYLDDPNYPRHKTAAFKIRELITRTSTPRRRSARSTSAPTIGIDATGSSTTRKTSSSISPTTCWSTPRSKGDGEPAGGRLHGAPAERDDLVGRHGSTRRDRAWRLDEAGRDGRAPVGQGDPGVSRAGAARRRAQE